MSQSWGQNLGLMEQKLAKKARFTCVVGAFDTSCHLTIGSSDHPTMCGIVSFALRLLERVANQVWQTAEKRNRLRGRQMIGWSDDPLVRWPLAKKPLAAKAFVAGESSFEAMNFRCCRPQLWDIIKKLRYDPRLSAWSTSASTSFPNGTRKSMNPFSSTSGANFPS